MSLAQKLLSMQVLAEMKLGKQAIKLTILGT